MWRERHRAAGLSTTLRFGRDDSFLGFPKKITYTSIAICSCTLDQASVVRGLTVEASQTVMAMARMTAPAVARKTAR
jgi:hypothetical protein